MKFTVCVKWWCLTVQQGLWVSEMQETKRETKVLESETTNLLKRVKIALSESTTTLLSNCHSQWDLYYPPCFSHFEDLQELPLMEDLQAFEKFDLQSWSHMPLVGSTQNPSSGKLEKKRQGCEYQKPEIIKQKWSTKKF